MLLFRYLIEAKERRRGEFVRASSTRGKREYDSAGTSQNHTSNDAYGSRDHDSLLPASVLPGVAYVA